MNANETKSILVVDDEDAVRSGIRKYLADTAGYDVEEAPGGPDALVRVTQRPFDAFVCDLRMPQMSGFDLIRALRRLCPDAIVIILTAVQDPDGSLQKMAKGAGVSAFLNKPCKASQLRDVLDASFAERDASREAFLSLEEFSQSDVEILSRLISEATRNAIAGIAAMVGREVNVTNGDHKQIPAREVAEILRNPEDWLVGVNLDIGGDTQGHMLLIYPPHVAYALVDLIMGEPLGQTSSLDAVEASALQEMGNIAGSFFLNSLADAAGMRLMSMPPKLIVGKAERVLDNAFRPLANRDAQVFAIRMVLETGNARVAGYFLALASPQFLNTLVERAGSCGSATY